MALRDSLGKKGAIISVAVNCTVAEAAQKMSLAKVGSIVVVDHENIPRGIFTERDLLDRVVSTGLDPSHTPISKVMSTPLVAVDGSASIKECYDRMQQTRCRHIPVVADGLVVGMITMRDILQAMMAEVEEENAQLKDYIRR